MMKKYLVFTLVFVFFANEFKSQYVDLLWANSFGGTGYDEGKSITTDSSGNLYTTGYFFGTVDFDPGVGVFNLSSNGGIRDIFIQKLDFNGNFLWAKSMGGSGDDIGYSITIDPNGYVYTTGVFGGTVDFDPGVGVFNLNSSSTNNTFIQKLDSNGDFIWAKSIINSISSSITTDSNGSVYTTGGFSGTVDFDPGIGDFFLTSNDVVDMFVQKLDSNGELIWVTSLIGALSDIGYSITTDINNNVYAAGVFGGTADFDPGNGVYNLTSLGNYDIFIQKLDSNGNFLWAKSMGGTVEDLVFSITTDIDGSIYTTGYFSNSADFDPGIGIFNLTSTGIYDIFIQKLDSNGNFIWAKSMGGVNTIGSGSYNSGHSIITDHNKNVYTTGYFEGTTDFNPGLGVFNLTSNGKSDIFIQKLDSNGDFLFATSKGGSEEDKGFSSTIDLNGHLYTTGRFQQTVDFDPGNGVFNLASFGGDDVFIQKLIFCDSTLDTVITVSVCGSYNLNGQTYNTSGTFTQILANFEGCDSIVTLNLTVNSNQFSPDFNVSQNLFITPPFTSQFNNTTPNASNYNFTWDFSDGTILQSNNSIVLHEYLFNGLYDVSLIAEDINSGCTDTIFYDDYISCSGGVACTHVSAINQTGPIIACVSDSVFLSCNTNSNFTYQWRLNGTYIAGANDTIFYPTQTGYYSVLIMQSGCPLISSDVFVIINSNSSTYYEDYQTACDSYTWMDGNTYTLSTNTPTYILTNAVGCDSVITLNLIINASTTAQLNEVQCGGNYILNGQTYSSSGTYTQSFTNAAGCDSTLTLNLNVVNIDPDFTANQQVLTNSPFNVQFTNNTPNLSNSNFTWDFGDGTIIQDNNSTMNHTYQFNGLYDVKLYADDINTSCEDSLIQLEYIYCSGGPNGIDEISSNISLHPNPTQDQITLEIEGYNGPVNVEVYNLTGKLLKTTKNTTISMGEYAKGIYVFKVSYGDITEEVRVVRD